MLLTTSRTGNQMLYASAAVEFFRPHGIPQDTWKDTILEHPKSKTAKMERYIIQGRMLMHGWKFILRRWMEGSGRNSGILL